MQRMSDIFHLEEPHDPTFEDAHWRETFLMRSLSEIVQTKLQLNIYIM